MSLKAVHLIFIAASIVLALGFGAWALKGYLAEHDRPNLLYAVGAGVATIALLIYARAVLRKFKQTSYQ